MVASSLRKSSTAFSMRVLAVAAAVLVLSIFVIALSLVAVVGNQSCVVSEQPKANRQQEPRMIGVANSRSGRTSRWCARRKAPEKQSIYCGRVACKFNDAALGGGDRRADALAEDGAADIAGLVHVKDHNRHAVVHAERDGHR